MSGEHQRPAQIRFSERLDDGVIALRPPTEADVPAIVEACQDPEIPRYTAVPSPYAEKDARAYLEESARARAAGTQLSLLVVDASTDALLGSIGLVEVVADERVADIGYWVAREARGRGIAVRAIGLLSAWTFDNLDIETLRIHTEPDNTVSQGVAARAGFERQSGLHPREVKGETREMIRFVVRRGRA